MLRVLPYLADLLLIIASLFWLFDWTIFDRIGTHWQAVAALEKLEKEGALSGGCGGINVRAADGSLVEVDAESTNAIVDFLISANRMPKSIDRSQVCCVMYKSFHMPRANGGAVGFRTLEIGTVNNGKIGETFENIGSQNEVKDWLQSIHQRNIALFVGAILLAGYLLQTLARFLDRKN